MTGTCVFTIINWYRRLIIFIACTPVGRVIHMSCLHCVYSGFVLYTLIMRSLGRRKFAINDSYSHWKQKIRFVWEGKAMWIMKDYLYCQTAAALLKSQCPLRFNLALYPGCTGREKRLSPPWEKRSVSLLPRDSIMTWVRGYCDSNIEHFLSLVFIWFLKLSH